MTDLPAFNFDNSFALEMEGFYTPWQGDKVPDPQVLRLNSALAEELGLDPDSLVGASGGTVLSGAINPQGGVPLAMVYAGHQFGGFSPRLGDGRAILVGEIVDTNNNRRDLHLKGSGRTPYSRGGDGKAVLGPVLREYLFGEAMHALNIPTTRALAAVTTGEKVMRDGFEQGAVLARVAASHIRVGTFQYFAARSETDKLRQLADYAIARHHPDLTGQYLAFFKRVRDAQADLIAQWMLVGFVHGVMNTDNMAISGETIDYGPCAFLDSYDPATVFSSIDRQGRYAFGNQPVIAQWNLSRLAETLIDLINPTDADDAIRALTAALDAFPAIYQAAWLRGMRSKLGLTTEQPEDLDLANGLMVLAHEQGADFTMLFRALADMVRDKPDPLHALLNGQGLEDWLALYSQRLNMEPSDAAKRADAMDGVNPVYIPRNHLVEAALSAASAGDMAPFDDLLSVLAQPFTRRPGLEIHEAPAPDSFGAHVTFCGT